MWTEHKSEEGNTETEVSGNMTAIVRKDKQNVNTMTSKNSTPAEGNFCDEHRKAQKLATVKCLDKSNMTNSYHISRQTWEWIKKLFSRYWTLPFSPLVVQNYHTNNSD